MPRTTITLPEWLPDNPNLGNGGLEIADGVYPIGGGYKPIGQFAAAVNGTLAADCLGATSLRAISGATFTVAGTTSNLYRYQSTGLTSLGSGYSTSASVGWRFTQWGDWMLASNGANVIQKLDMAAGVPAFAALGGSPPVAELISVVRDFVVIGRIAGNTQNMGWSAIGNAEGWTAGLNQSGTQLMVTGGDIQGITGGEFGLVLQERRLVRMTYAGLPLIWQFDQITDSLGCVARGSVVRIGAVTYFLSQQGFARCDGNSAEPIGDEKVNRTIQDETNRSFYGNMSVTVDTKNSLIFWSIPNAAPSTRVYVYNYALDRWSTFSQGVQRLFLGLSEGVTLEGLDVYGTIEAVPSSLDDDVWKGGYPLVTLVDDARRIGTLTGTPKAATFRTGDIAVNSGRMARMTKARMLADTSSGLTVKIGGGQRAGDSPTIGTFTGVNRVGDIPVRFSRRYPRFEWNIAAGTQWSEAVGFDIEYEPGGV